MRTVSKLVLAATALLSFAPSAFALSWSCTAPEIDGPAGLSALAVLVSAGIMAYERSKA